MSRAPKKSTLSALARCPRPLDCVASAKTSLSLVARCPLTARRRVAAHVLHAKLVQAQQHGQVRIGHA